MRKRGFVFWFAFVIAGIFALAVASLFVLIWSFRASVPGIPDRAIVSLDLAASYPEDPLYALGGPFFGVEGLTFRDLLFAIERAKTDDRVEKLLLRVRGNTLGWARASELRDQILDFKSSGKPVVAFIEFSSNRDYLVASAADEIFLHPRGMVELSGVRAEIMFLASSLDKLGIEPEFERVGRYKDAPDTFLRHSMSEATREATGALVQTIHEHLVDAIAEGRSLDESSVKAVLEKGPLTPGEAMELGLVDGLRFLDEVESAEGTSALEKESVRIADYRRATTRTSAFGADARIAIIYGIGPIVPGGSGEDALFGRVMGADTIASAFEKVRKDDSIDGVVFRIDSPGGSDVASDVIWREAMLTRQEKPVIVSMGSVAASGGYWIATASDAIVAESTTITGSIGIYAGKFNLSGLYEKLGIGVDGVSSTESADFFSDNRSFTADERARLSRVLQDGYQAFLRRVADGRGMSTEAVEAVAQGRVWSGEMALQLGLVDEIGGLERALEIAKEKAGFDPGASVELRIYPEKRNFLEALLESIYRASAPLRLNLFDRTKLVESSPMLQLLARGVPLALMPYQLEVN
ncbi:MAG TPA: signal peptide peptidase SppA [Vicinamibacteria bacterium]|nr:signal peptide peptidase SppA [Vicinamibacteria bacterium]